MKTGSSSLLRFVLVSALSILGPGSGPAGANPPTTFTHGVASGDVTPFSAVLWTRVDRRTPLTIEVSLESSFHVKHFHRVVHATAENDFTAKVVATPLLPDRLYYYRWRHGSAISPVGTFRTAPAPDLAKSLRFTWTGDSDGTRINGVPAWNNFEVLNAVRAEGGDFFIYLGDTIYPDSIRRTAPPAATLDEFRATYKEARGYAALQALLQAVSTYAIWDDHEVRDDYAGQTVDPALYANGQRAFLDYMPTEDIQFASPGCVGTPRFRVFRWGTEVELIILDTHSCRSASALPACTYPSPPLPPGTFDFAPTLPGFLRAMFPAFFPPLALIPNCLPTINNPARTMLGEIQKHLFKDALASTARIKIVLSPSTFAQTYVNPYSRWEGYAAERAELIRFIRDHAIRVVFLSTDDHRNVIHQVFIDRLTEPMSAGTEFVTGPIATLTDQGTLLNFFGLPPDTDCSLPANAGHPGCVAVAAQQGVLSFAGVNCRHLNKFSYGAVEVNAATRTVTVTLKDDQGQVIRDQLNPAIECRGSIGP